MRQRQTLARIVVVDGVGVRRGRARAGARDRVFAHAVGHVGPISGPSLLLDGPAGVVRHTGRRRRGAPIRVVVRGGARHAHRVCADLGEELAGVAAGGAAAEGLAVGRWEREHLAQTVVLRLESLDAMLEVLEVCGAAGAERTLDVAGAVRGEVVVAFAAALGSGNVWEEGEYSDGDSRLVATLGRARRQGGYVGRQGESVLGVKWWW
jgi:hypothetical protein